MKRTAAILLLALVALSAFAEEVNHYADSLLHIVRTKRLTDTYRCSYDTAKVYLDLQIAAKASGNKRLVQKAYQAGGNLYARQGQFILAIESFLNILKNFDGDESSRDYIIAHGNIGECYHRMGNPKRALHYLERERMLAEQYCEPTGIGQSYCELGYVYLALGDADKALECMLRVKPKGKGAPVGDDVLTEKMASVCLFRCVKPQRGSTENKQ